MKKIPSQMKEMMPIRILGRILPQILSKGKTSYEKNYNFDQVDVLVCLALALPEEK